MKQGDAVLDLGRHRRHRRLRRAVRAQRRRHAGRRRVVARQGRRCSTSSACEAVIDRKAEGYRFWTDEHTQDESRVAALRQGRPRARRRRPRHRVRAPRPPDDGRVDLRLPSAAAPSSRARRRRGYMIEFDNRHFWMKLKRLIVQPLRQLRRGVGGQPADRPGPHPAAAVGACTRSTEVGEAARAIHRNEHEGKIGVLCLAPTEGLGIDDPEQARPHRRGQDHPVPPPRAR